MPMTPSSFVPSERLSPGDGVYSQAPSVAPEKDYAPQQIESMGQATSQLGGTELRTGQAMTDRIGETIDDANVKQAETQFITGGNAIARGYMQTAGNNAIQGYDSATQALAKAKTDAAASLTNPIQQRMYNQVAAMHLANFGTQMYDHQHQQTVSYGITSAKARSETYALQALQNMDDRYQVDSDGNNTGAFHTATGVMEGETRAAARLAGFADDSDQSEAMVRDAWTSLNHAMIAKMLDNHDAAGADKWLTEQQAADHMDVKDIENLGSNVKQEKDRQYYEDKANKDYIPRAITGGANAPVTFAPIATGAPINPTTPADFPITDKPGSPRPYGRTHNGYDIAMPANTPLMTPADGTVTKVWNDDKFGGGQSIEVTLPDGRTVGMAHLSATNAKVGDQVTQGQVIGKSGQSGNATGPSVHYMLRNADGSVGDPFAASQPQPDPAGIADPQVAQRAIDLNNASNDDPHTKKMIQQYIWRMHGEARGIQDQSYEEDVKQPAVQALYANGGNYNAIPGAIRAKLKPQDAFTLQNFELPVKDDMPTVAGFITQPQTVTESSVNQAYANGQLSNGSYKEFLQRAVTYQTAPDKLLDATVDANDIKVIASRNGYKVGPGSSADDDAKIAYLTYQVQHDILQQEQSTGKKLDSFAKDKIITANVAKIATTTMDVRSRLNPERWFGSPYSFSTGVPASKL